MLSYKGCHKNCLTLEQMFSLLIKGRFIDCQDFEMIMKQQTLIWIRQEPPLELEVAKKHQ
jgi:hypothetical protein